MIDFEPAPWPEDILDYFAEDVAIAEVPKFLHELIAEFTETLASIDVDFRYENIQIKFDGAVLVFVENEATYNQSFQETLEAMIAELTRLYRRTVRDWVMEVE